MNIELDNAVNGQMIIRVESKNPINEKKFIKELVKKQYNIENDSEFPTTSRFDPVSQVLGIRPNELFEIERPSKTAIKTKFYRICST